MKILDGRKIADNIISDLANNISKLSSKPGLAIVLIGNDLGSHIYVDLKEKAAKEVGINIKKYLLPDDVTEEEVIKLIDDLNKDVKINGILVQFPLPKHLDENRIIQEIDPLKDVDGFHPQNIELLLNGQDCIVPGLAEGIVKLIDDTKVNYQNQKAVIVANSDVFSQPLEYLLKQKRLEVKITKPNESGFDEIVKESDFVIVAIGQPNFIKGDMIKEGAIIIDVGYNRIDNKAVGDADFESVKDKVSWITPVPGGVGPLTVAMLLNNVYKAYAKQKSLNI